MEWLTSIRKVIDYMEKHLQEDIRVEDIAGQVYLSPFLLQRGFSLMTGYGLGEYLRCRRLHQAAEDLRNTQERITDIGMKYGYETTESFIKAFARFHGATPSQVRDGARSKAFLPLTIQITIQGGSQMDYRIAPMFPFRLIGFQREFDNAASAAEIPAFWDEILGKYAGRVYAGEEPENPCERALVDYGVGEYGVCIDDVADGRFRYLIAGMYTGGTVPEGMIVYEFPRCDWAVFDCVGPIPQALQSMNARIFREWLPGNQDYELCGNASVEWYDRMNADNAAPDARSAVWIPVKKREAR